MGERPPTPPGRANGDGTNGRVHFSVFEVDLSAGELRKSGLKIKLHGQPFEVLALLLERPGELVTREELQQKLWASDTVVDFELGLNKAINKLREALGDVANTPRYVETLPRRGYRFIAPVEVHAAAEQRSVPPAIKRLVPRWMFLFDGIRKYPWPAVGMATMLVLGTFIGYVAKQFFYSNPSSRVTRSVIKLEPGYILEGWRLPPPWGFDQPTMTALAISSSGRFIIYSAIRENPGPRDKSALYLRRTDELQAKPVAGTEGGASPFLSPDDRWVAFWADGSLKKVPIEGGIPVTLTDRMCCSSPSSYATGSWGVDNKIVFAPSVQARLYMVSGDGGNPELLTSPDQSRGEFSHRLPHWLPDGKGVVFTILRDWFDQHPRMAVLDLESKTWRVLLEDAADAHYVPTGHLVFLRDGTIMVAPFNLARRELTGQAVPAVPNVIQALNTDANNNASGQFSISNSGCLVYAPGGINPDRQDKLVWVDREGNATPVTSFSAPFFAPRLSPDGRKISYITAGREWHAWIYDLDRRVATQLTSEGKTDQAHWTPDGKHVVFKWWEPGHESNIFEQAADGSSPMQRLTTSDNHQVPGSFSPDGTTLAFVELNSQTGWDINLLDMYTRKVTPFLNSKANEEYPEFSPDGRWIAYTSDESGRIEVYVRPFPGPGGKWQISAEGGSEPLWSRDGKHLFYVGSKNDQYWVTDVHTDGTFSASKPRVVFTTEDTYTAYPTRGWDISPDGGRFLMVKSGGRKSQPVTELILVENWLEEVRRLTPTGKK